eukprot:m.99086 g.99086  ORF g.99086 m.99086 type:complete len:222 (+) comp13662_c0_seq2:140-805(+)
MADTDTNPSAPENSFVIPGDTIDIHPHVKKVKLGPGARAEVNEDDTVFVAKWGVLCSKQNEQDGPAEFYVISDQKRPEISVGDTVIGVVVGKPAEHFAVDIGLSRPAILPILSFEGATKRNRPNFNIGDTVYARVSFTSKFLEAELTCMNAQGKSGGLGKLSGGYLLHCSLAACRRFLSPSAPVLQALGEQIKFEIAVGVNGSIWIDSDNTVQHTYTHKNF